MTDWSIWPATNGPNTDTGDASDISRGVLFRLSSTGWLKSIRFYRGTTNVGNHTGGAPIGRLYTASDGLAVPGTDVTFTPSGTGWQVASVVTPVLLNPNVSYKAVVLTGNYTATSGYFASGPGVGGIVQGIITAPDAGGNPSGIGSIQQGSYRQPTSGLQYPNQYFGGGNYWVDVVVADADPGTDIRDVTGSVSISGLQLTGAFGGKIGVADATVPVGLNLQSDAVSKASDLTAVLPVSLVLTSTAGEKVVTETASLPVSVILSAQSEAVGAGVPAPVSEVLCSSWANWLDVPQRMKDAVPTVTEAEWQANLMLASEILWMLSGRRWYGGGCTESATLRSYPPQQGRGSWPYHPSWGRCSCWTTVQADLDGYRHGSSTLGVYAIALPRSPVTNIVSVSIAGAPFTDYEMLRNGWIERTDGGAWGLCGGDTTIVYQYGEPPPQGGKLAAIALAYELVRESVGDSDCRLPSNVVSITRQGVTIERMAAAEFQALLRTGLPDVDRWLAAVNPQSRPQRARVWSPDIPSAHRSYP